MQYYILHPALAMVLLTVVVFLRLLHDRLRDLRTQRIHPQKIASRSAAAQLLADARAADHFQNLFEVPVLFYVLCGFLAITKLTTVLLLAMAWGYVCLRGLHAWIAVTHNNVIRRFQAYISSSVVLYAMWGIFAVRLLTARSD
jgi:hypothetical protein